MVTKPSVPTSTNAPTADGSLSAALARTPRRRPAEATEVILTKSRRSIFSTSMSHLLRGGVNRPPDAHVGSAAAQIAAHRFIDLSVGRLLRFVKERRGVHDLSGLTVATLRDV